MQSFFLTTTGRYLLILGGVDLAVMGFASLVEDPAITRALLALVPMLTIAMAINIVVISSFEIGGLVPVGLLSAGLFFLGVFVYGLDSATHAGPAAGTVLVSIGVLFALLGLRPAAVPLEHPELRESVS